MNRLTIFGHAALIAAVGGSYAWVTLRSEWGGADPPGLLIADEPPKHLVTRRMAAASEAMVERIAPPFDTPASDGQRYRLDELCRGGPVVLTFVKDGCPCSESAQRFFNRLHAAYPQAPMFGVIDVEAEQANRWAGRFRVAYPLLLDPGLNIMQNYHAENSAYVVLVDDRGRIRKHWPGYSAGMLRELGATLAGLLGTAERPLDVADAPEEEYSGCPFEF